MSGPAERIDGIPPPLPFRTDVQDIVLYGVDLSLPSPKAPDDQERDQKALAYGFCYQGHCYRLSIPAEYHFHWHNSRPAIGCGFDTVAGYRMWLIPRTTRVNRIEKRGGSAEELILEFNIPGRNPASLTYSARVTIASTGGKIYE
jgi:hypothetical protein